MNFYAFHNRRPTVVRPAASKAAAKPKPTKTAQKK